MRGYRCRKVTLFVMGKAENFSSYTVRANTRLPKFLLADVSRLALKPGTEYFAEGTM